VHELMGRALIADTDFDGAIQAFTRRVEVSPNYAPAHRALAETYLQLGRDDEALAELTAAALIEPADALAHAGRAQLHLRNGRYQDAAGAARAALARDGTNLTALYALGTALVRLGRAGDGEDALARFRAGQDAARARDERGWELRLLRQTAAAHLERGELTEAVERLQAAVALQPDVDGYSTLGAVLKRAGRTQDALDALEQAVAHGGGPMVHALMADLLAALGRIDDSRRHLALAARARDERLRGRCPTVTARAATVVLLASAVGAAAGATTPSRTGDGLAGSQPVFENVAAAAGLVFQHVNGASAARHVAETLSGGGVLFDADGDGWLDVLLVDGGSPTEPAVAARARHRLFHNRGNGTFEDVSARAGLVGTGYGMGACAADYDNDGRVDLYLTQLGPNALFHNNGDGTFSDRTRAAGGGADTFSTSCAFSDVDGDGDLDLFVATYVDVSGPLKTCGSAQVPAYCRPDVFRGLPELLFVKPGRRHLHRGRATVRRRRAGGQRAGRGSRRRRRRRPCRPVRRQRHDPEPASAQPGDRACSARRRLRREWPWLPDGRVRGGMGTDLADYDGDGRLDLVVTNFEFEGNNLFRNLGAGVFADASYQSGVAVATLPFVGFGVAFLDYDNDTDLDLAIANGHVLDNTSVFRSSSRYGQRNLLLVN
jgi:tetratricopeptide (TPR) repeat protein